MDRTERLFQNFGERERTEKILEERHLDTEGKFLNSVEEKRYRRQQSRPSLKPENGAQTLFISQGIYRERKQYMFEESTHACINNRNCNAIESQEPLFSQDSLSRDRRVTDWKEREGRFKEWRRSPIIKLTGSISLKEIMNHDSRFSQIFDKKTADLPVAMLRRQINSSRVAIQNRGATVSSRRRKSYRERSKAVRGERLSDYMSTAVSSGACSKGFSHGDLQWEPQQWGLDKQGTAPVFESIRKRLEPLRPLPLLISNKKYVATSLIPYENHVGSILGGQFRLGCLIREEDDGDVYSVSDLNAAIENLEAKAFTLRDVPQADFEARKRGMNKLSRAKICSIDQAGRKFIIYQCPHQQVKSESMLQVFSRASKAKECQESKGGAKSFQASTQDQGGKEHKRKRRRRRHRGERRQKETSKSESGPVEVDGKILIMKEDLNARNTAQLPSEPVSTETDGTPPKDQTIEKQVKKRLRKRGKKKLSIPEFDSIYMLENFWREQRDHALQAARSLFSIKTTDSTNHSRHPKAVKKYERQLERKSRAQEAQVGTLKRRLERALSLQCTWNNLASALRKDVELLRKDMELNDELLAFSMQESLWMRRKKLPIPSKCHQVPEASALQQVHGVYTREDLGEFNNWWRWELRECVNGRENLHRRD